jgi:uncharacterized coiled-coil protein SlyX
MTDGASAELASLEQRMARLEATIEALQDQVHRESERHQREIAVLHQQLKPEQLARTLSDDARRRGI